MRFTGLNRNYEIELKHIHVLVYIIHLICQLCYVRSTERFMKIVHLSTFKVQTRKKIVYTDLEDDNLKRQMTVNSTTIYYN